MKVSRALTVCLLATLLVAPAVCAALDCSSAPAMADDCCCEMAMSAEVCPLASDEREAPAPQTRVVLDVDHTPVAALIVTPQASIATLVDVSLTSNDSLPSSSRQLLFCVFLC
ncbi:MAG: hypothetical protein AAGD38_14065 [Acidobacteriota bacterium]